MSTLAEELIAAVNNIKPRLSLRHSEKLIPPVELKRIQKFWTDSPTSDKHVILDSFDKMDQSDLQKFFTLISRQEFGITTLIAMRESQILSKKQFSGNLKTTLTDVLQNNLDSALDISQITLNSNDVLLNKFKDSDRVHKIANEESMRRRLGNDRRVFYFTHKQNPLQPLIVVNIALTSSISNSISDILDGRDIEAPENFNAAIFYSISAMETGLRGIDLGHRLIVSACGEMAEDDSTSGLVEWSSLSPVPHFRSWVEAELCEDPDKISAIIGAENMNLFSELVHTKNAKLLPPFRETLPKLLIFYLLNVKKPDGSTQCAVENFHVRNGAVLWRVNFGANLNAYGMAESLSMMVNYRYYMDEMWEHALNYQLDEQVPVSDSLGS